MQRRMSSVMDHFPKSNQQLPPRHSLRARKDRLHIVLDAGIHLVRMAMADMANPNLHDLRVFNACSAALMLSVVVKQGGLCALAATYRIQDLTNMVSLLSSLTDEPQSIGYGAVLGSALLKLSNTDRTIGQVLLDNGSLGAHLAAAAGLNRDSCDFIYQLVSSGARDAVLRADLKSKQTSKDLQAFISDGRRQDLYEEAGGVIAAMASAAAAGIESAASTLQMLGINDDSIKVRPCQKKDL